MLTSEWGWLWGDAPETVRRLIGRWPLDPFHKVVGGLAILFAWVQPFNALFRCAPGAAHRYIFIIVHRVFGGSACLLAGTLEGGRAIYRTA